MAKRKTQKGNDIVTIDGKNYNWSKLPDEVKSGLNHVSDLDKKIQQGQFNIEQLIGGRTFWMSKVNQDLKNETKDSTKP
tara:strand:- start:2792 stop:3028 length:237 start_codon:yes stop_codon:yes gene_type:complete